jgi:hypothetical protein
VSILALTASSAPGQITRFEGQSIVEITFSPAQLLDPADLANARALKKGAFARGRCCASH